ncbi:CARDB domain-containing protein [Cystobacter ferrugineus]|nr:CARDB domain-containing protein [Cystobacter ferrugineus]
MAAGAAFAFLDARKGLDGLYRDDLDLPSTTAEVILALEAWDKLASADGVRLIAAFQALQRADGSWEGSVYQTARVLRVLQLLTVPNLAVTGVTLSASSVVEGEGAAVDVLVYNTGFVVSAKTWVQAFDSNGASFGSPEELPALDPGASTTVRLLLDTVGHANSQQLFVVVDPSGTLDETREDDNRVAEDFIVHPATIGVDVFVSSGSETVSPARVTQVPATHEVSVQVGNAGRTTASNAVVSLYSGGMLLASQTVPSLAHQQQEQVKLSFLVEGGPYPIDLLVRIEHPGEAEANKDNNAVSLSLGADPLTVGLEVASLTVSPATVEQEQTVSLAFDVSNTGTARVDGAKVAVSVVAADGVVVATLPLAAVPALASGETKSGSASWTATYAGSYRVEARAFYEGKTWGGGKSAPLTVHALSTPDLVLGTGALSTNPQPPLVGKEARIFARVRNAGADVGPFKVGFFLGDPDAGGTLLGHADVSELKEGAWADVSIPYTFTSANEHVLVARADFDGTVGELNEKNNSSTLAVSPRPIADLVLSEGDILPDNAFPRKGESVSVKVSVFNQGGQSSQEAQVKLYLGSPEAAGTLIDSASLPPVEAGDRGQVSLTWSTSGLSGPQTLVAIVNGDHAFDEQSFGNNRVERRVLVQDGAVALTEPFFSPNGDGVKDSTEIFYRLAEAGPSEVRIATQEGVLRRTLTGPVAASSTSVSVIWDGRDEKGQVVKDGAYRLSVFAGEGEALASVGTAQVVVDTNGVRIEETDPSLTRHAFFKNILGKPKAMPDESGLAFMSNGGTSAPPCGFYSQPLLGGDAELIFSAGPRRSDGACIDTNRQGALDTLLDFAISPDGSTVAFIHVNDYQRRVSRISRGQTTPVLLPVVVGDEGPRSPILFQEGSQRLWFGIYKFTLPGDIIRNVDLWNPSDRVDVIDTRAGYVDFKLSSDASRIAMESGTSSGYGSRCLSAIDVMGKYVYSDTFRCQTINHGLSFGWGAGGKYLLTVRENGLEGEGPTTYGTQLVSYDVSSYNPGVHETLLELPFRTSQYSSLNHSISFAPSVHGDALVYNFNDGGDTDNAASLPLPSNAIGIIAPIVSGTPRPFARIPGVIRVNSLNWSPRGTFLHGAVKTSEGDVYWAMHSLANLSAQIRASRPPGSSSISFRGVASDLNFDSYTVSVRPLGSTSAPVVLTRRTTPVIDGVLATWSPPGPGTYEVFLSVTDKAGNSRRSTTRTIWSNAALVSNLSVDPGLFSPNGDGKLDALTVRYELSKPITTDFVVLDAKGDTVHTITRDPSEDEGREFVWTGYNAAGRVPDGDYLLRADRAVTAFTVDTTPPVVDLAWGNQLPDGKNYARFLDAYPAYAYDSTGQSVAIPSVGAWVSWRSQDLHPGEARLEAWVGSEATVIQEMGGKNGGMEHRPVEELRGARLRVSSVDAAGNAPSSNPELMIPEKLFLVGIGDASVVDSAGTLRYGGRQIPRIDLLRWVSNDLEVRPDGQPQPNPTMSPSGFSFKPQRYAFALANTVGKRIVSYSVRYPSPVGGGVVVEDTHVAKNLKMLAEDAIVWDARTLPEREFILTIEAHTEDGTFSTKVPFYRPASVGACVQQVAGTPMVSVTTSLSYTGSSDRLAPGATLRFFPEGSATAELTAEIETDDALIGDGLIHYSTLIPRGSLTQCRYRIELQGMRVDRRDVDGNSFLNACGLLPEVYLNGSEPNISVVETFDRKVESVEVYQRDGAGHWSFATLLPSFEGRAVGLLPELVCGADKLRLVARLADGSVFDSAQPTDFRSCAKESESSCGLNLQVFVDRREGLSACGARDAIYDIKIETDVQAGAGEWRIEASLVDSSARRYPVGLMSREIAGKAVATGVVETHAATSLPEGVLNLHAVFTDAKGRKLENKLATLIVDRTLPRLSIATPAEGALLCAVESPLSDGTRERAFNVMGTLSDEYLEFAELKLRSVQGAVSLNEVLFKGEKGKPARISRVGSLWKLSVDELSPGDYVLTGHARDFSGGESCLAPRTFHVSDGVALQSVYATPRVFGGPGANVSETVVRYELDGTAKVSVSALDPEGKTVVLQWSTEQSPGSHEFDWSGSLADGSSISLNGRYLIQVEAVDACGRTAVGTTEAVFDTIPPMATITVPASGSSVGAVVEVRGTATDANFKNYTLEFEGSTLEPLLSPMPIMAGVLGSISTDTLSAGDHTLVLEVQDEAGWTTKVTRSVSVSAGEVVAGFSLSPGLLSPNLPLGNKQVLARIALRQRAEVMLQAEPARGPTQTLFTGTLNPGAPDVRLAPSVFGGPGFEEDREYTVKLIATAGAITETAQAQLVLDHTPPSVGFSISPQKQGFVQGHGQVIGSISDPHLTSWSVLFGAEGKEVEIGRGSESREQEEILAEFDGLPDGPHRFVLTATDGAGNKRDHTVFVTSDMTSPRVAFRYPLSGEYLSEQKILGHMLVGARVSETHPSRLTLETKRDLGSTPVLIGSVDPLVEGDVDVPWDISSESDGRVTLIWTALDLAGNSTSTEIPVVVDNTLPRAELTKVSVSSGTLRFEGTASDTNLEYYRLELASGPSSGAVLFTEVARGQVSTDAGTLVVLPVLPADGVYTARLTVFDKAGNEETSEPYQFAIDTHPPRAPVLSAKVTSGRNVALNWTPNSADSDIKSYRLERATGQGAFSLLSTVDHPAISKTDEVATNGSYRYRVIAFDETGLQSQPSNEVSIDLNPPVAILFRPAQNGLVSGLVEVQGSAYAAEDFKEYRLLLGEGPSPTQFTRILSSSQIVSSGPLGTIDFSNEEQDSVRTIRLEVEDTHGNVAKAEVSVMVDNLAPLPPKLLSVLPPDSANVTVTWEKNNESDLAGYLLFRNGVLVNSAGVSPSDLTAYLLSPASTSFLDKDLPDGEHTYVLRAMDKAGNLSEPSNELKHSLSLKPAVAKLTYPPSMTRLSGPVSLEATATDLDLTEVRFLARARSDEEFRPIGVVKTFPYTLDFDPAKFLNAVDPEAIDPTALEVKAVACDPSCVDDASVVSVYYFWDKQPKAPLISLSAEVYTVTVNWTDQNPDSSVGHLVYRGTSLIGASSRPRPGAKSIQAIPAQTPDTAARAYDQNDSTYWTSTSDKPRTWEMEFQQRMVVDQIHAVNAPGVSGQRAHLWVRVRGLWVRLNQEVQDPSVPVTINPPLEVEAVRYAFLQLSSAHSVGLAEVKINTLPFVTGPQQDVSWSYGTTTLYSVTAVSPLGLTARTEDTITTYNPSVYALSSMVVTPRVVLQGALASSGIIPASSTIEVLRGDAREVVATGTAGADGKFVVTTPLDEGLNTLSVRARYPTNNVSSVSYPTTVIYEQLRLALSSREVTDSKVSFTIDVCKDTSTLGECTAASYADRLDRLEVRRVLATGGTPVTTTLGPRQTQIFSETKPPNGRYLYTVVAVDRSGSETAPSNTLEINVEATPPEAPQDLAVNAPSGGGELQLTWSGVPGAEGYELQRALTNIEPFGVQKSIWVPASDCTSGAPATSCFVSDTDVTNGVTYYYRVLAVDGFGNQSMPSDVKSGMPAQTGTPEAPRLFAPTWPGRPVTLATSLTSVSGMTELGMSVELFVNDAPVGMTTPTGGYALVETMLPFKYEREPDTSYSLSADGNTVAYLSGEAGDGSGKAIVVEDLATHEVQVLTHPKGFFGLGSPYLSPDKTRVAVYGRCIAIEGAYCTSLDFALLTAQVGSKAWTRLNVTRPDAVNHLVWSPDSTRVAYSTQGLSGEMLAVSAMDGVEKIVDTRSSYSAGPFVAVWTGAKRLAAVSMSSSSETASLVEWDIDSLGTPRSLLSGATFMGSESLVLSPSGARLLVRAQLPDDSSSFLYLVDTRTTSSRKLGPTGFNVVFSHDETRIAYEALSSSSELQLWLRRIDSEDAGNGAGTLIGNLRAFDYSYRDARLLWTQGGLFQFSASGSAETLAPRRLDWGVPFTFPDVALASGTNQIMARAKNTLGVVSPYSQPIEVIFDQAQVPDLTVSAAVQPAIPRKNQSANAAITVKNKGGGSVNGVNVAVSVLGSDGSIRPAGVFTLSGTIGPGATSSVLVPLDISGLVGGQELVAVVDPEWVVQDAERGNNQVTVPFDIAESEGVAMGIQLSSRSLAANESSTATVMLANAGPARHLSVVVELRDSNDAWVRTLGVSELFSPLGADSQAFFKRTITVQGLLAGTYKVVARAKEAGVEISTAQAHLDVLPDNKAALVLSASRIKYVPGEPIDLMTRVENRSSNTVLSGATLSLVVEAMNGDVLEMQNLDLPNLAPGAFVSQAFVLSAALPPGTYRAVARLRLEDDTVLTSAETSLVVEGRPNLQGVVSVVNATGSPLPVIPPGENVSLKLEVLNAGTAPAAAAVARVRVLESDSLAVVWSQDVAAGTLGMGVPWTHALTVPIALLPPRSYVVSFAAVWDGEQEKSLSTATFGVLDTEVPLITTANLADGMIVKGQVVASLGVMDAHSSVESVVASVVSAAGVKEVRLARVAGTDPRNGVWSASIPLDAEGSNVITFSARDTAGNDGRLKPRSGNPISFKVEGDAQKPVIVIAGVEDGGFYKGSVSPVVTVSDSHLAGSTVTLNGVPFVSGRRVEEEGSYQLLVRAQDAAGNESSASATFVVDLTTPVITVSGVSDGELLSRSVTPVVSVTDSYLATRSILIDGRPWFPRTTISTDGPHVIEVNASDKAGNTKLVKVSFTIDKTPPDIVISGVERGGIYGSAVTPVVSVTDPHLATSSIRLDGSPWVPGTAISTEGLHLIEVNASDGLGNSRSETVSFTIDKTPPSVVISGVKQGGIYVSAVTPVVSVTDPHLATSSIRLDGSPWVSGTSVMTDGPHVLQVDATDLAGQTTSVTVSFTIKVESGPLHIEVSGGYEPYTRRVLALLGNGRCTPEASKVARISNYFEVALQQIGGFLRVTTDQNEFIAQMRSGLFNTFILMPDRSLDEGCLWPAVSVPQSPLLCRGLADRARADRGAFIVIHPDSSHFDMAACSEVVGGPYLPSDAPSSHVLPGYYFQLYGGEEITVGTDAFRLNSAVNSNWRPAAWYEIDMEAPENDVAVLSASYQNSGFLSSTFILGFDPSKASTPEMSSKFFQKLLEQAWSAPGESHIGLEVIPMSIQLKNLDSTYVDVEVEHLLGPNLLALAATPAANISVDGHIIQWSRVSLPPMSSVVLRYYQRIPDVYGEQEAYTRVYGLLASGRRQLYSAPGGGFFVDGTGADLLMNARNTVANFLPATGDLGSLRHDIESVLDSIETRPVYTKADVEALILDLYGVVHQTRSMSFQYRKSVEFDLLRLIFYWESRWSAL